MLSLRAEVDLTAALMEDLDSSGLLEETLIIWMGEFGRTPLININGYRGRDHFPDVTPVVIGGAGVAQGQVIGQTIANGTPKLERIRCAFRRFGDLAYQECD